MAPGHPQSQKCARASSTSSSCETEPDPPLGRRQVRQRAPACARSATDAFLTHAMFTFDRVRRAGPSPNWSGVANGPPTPRRRSFPGSAGCVASPRRCGGSGGVTTAQEPCNIKTIAVLRFGWVASGAQAEALGCRGCDKRSVDAFAIALEMGGSHRGRREMVNCTIPLERS